MCLEIIVKKNKDFIIHYVPGAKCLTDPPLSLTGLIKQRRRWFNGTMFASFHVLGSMCRVWKRKKSSFCRNILFMFLYFYMILTTALSYILVGTFFAAFSIFIRGVLPSSNCPYDLQVANVIEIIYVVFLAGCLFLSITVTVDWAETGYRIFSLFMGCFSVLMGVATIMYAFEDDVAFFVLILGAVWISTYILPLLVNLQRLRFVDFVKGILYTFYLSPTYVNIFTIFAIGNIHDVSWGSRPSTMDATQIAAASKKDVMYKNFRSNFLIIWIVINTSIAIAITELSRNGEAQVISYIAIFMTFILFVKLACSILHVIVTCWHLSMTKKYIRKCKSTVFKNVTEEMRQEGN